MWQVEALKGKEANPPSMSTHVKWMQTRVTHKRRSQGTGIPRVLHPLCLRRRLPPRRSNQPPYCRIPFAWWHCFREDATNEVIIGTFPDTDTAQIRHKPWLLPILFTPLLAAFRCGEDYCAGRHSGLIVGFAEGVSPSTTAFGLF